MRVLICGGRTFENIQMMYRVLDPLLEKHAFSVVIEGEAPGADSCARSWANDHNLEVEKYPADWEKYGRSAGPIRNKQMLDEGKPDLVIAFSGGRGTANMCKQAIDKGVPVLYVDAIGRTSGWPT